MDVDSIDFGQDFRDAIRSRMADADALVVVIGPGFDPARLAHANDFVRLELLEAFNQDKLIVPVVIEGASMPGPDDLPAKLKALSYRNAAPLRPDPDFRRGRRAPHREPPSRHRRCLRVDRRPSGRVETPGAPAAEADRESESRAPDPDANAAAGREAKAGQNQDGEAAGDRADAPGGPEANCGPRESDSRAPTPRQRDGGLADK
jgi:hypothetical protein